MKSFLLKATSALVALSVAAPVLAYSAPTEITKLSRRLVRSEAILKHRVPSGAMAVDLLLRERKEAQKDTTGRADLSRSQITTRIRTIRGSTPEARQYWKVGRPSRRAIINQADESMLELPSILVETGAKGSLVISRTSRRTVRILTRAANVVRVQATVNR